jgi:hypothetical protein
MPSGSERCLVAILALFVVRAVAHEAETDGLPLPQNRIGGSQLRIGPEA